MKKTYRHLPALAGLLCCLSPLAEAHVSNIEFPAGGSVDNGSFYRDGWIAGTNPTLGDSHHVAEGNFFVFRLQQPSFVDIGFAHISGAGGEAVNDPAFGLDPAFSLYAGLLPDLAHDDTDYDPLFGRGVDQAPGDPYLSKYLADGVTPNPAFTPEVAAWYAANYTPHNGYRDTLNYSATAGQYYEGQFDALGDWSMANEDARPGEPDTAVGNWAKIRYLTHVNQHATVLGADGMPAGDVDDAPESLVHYPLPAGTYTIAASGAACDAPLNRRCGITLFGRVSFSATPNTPPSFISPIKKLRVAPNGPAVDLIPYFHASDTDTGQVETWRKVTAPLHGTLTIAKATAASGGTDLTPGGTISYKPAAGFTGSDSFRIRVGDGLAVSIRKFTIYVK